MAQINDKIFKEKKIKHLKSVFGVATKGCNKCCYATWHGVKTNFECLLVCAVKAYLLKLQDADYERDADRPNLTSAQ